MKVCKKIVWGYRKISKECRRLVGELCGNYTFFDFEGDLRNETIAF